MNTREFLSLVLPSTGLKYLAELRTFEKTEAGKTRTIQYFQHYPYDDAAGLAGAALALDDEGKHVYFALAGFSEPVQAIDRRTGAPGVTTAGKPRLTYRTQDLAVAVKALWADIDCSAEKAASGQGYATKRDAATAVAQFCAATKTPAPLIVDSGGGLHCYWPLAHEIRADQWLQVARMWRSITQHFGLRSDPARDIDVASVLRPVGTTNRKPGRDERTVRVVNDPAKVRQLTAGEWVKHIGGLIRQHNIAVKPASAPQRHGGINDDLSANEYPPSSAVQIAKHCAQITRFYEARGDVSEPLWRAALGLLKHTAEGESVAHEWSAGHPDYDEAETQAKLDHWAAGPTTCAHFQACDSAGCAGCKHAGNITSPIQLGVVVAEVPVVVAPVTPGVAPVALPTGFSVVRGHLCRTVMDAEGVNHVIPFLSTVVLPVERVYDPVIGTYVMRCMVEKGTGDLRYFSLPTSTIHSPKLPETLSGYEVFMLPGNKAIEHVREYFRTSNTILAETAPERRAVSVFGWDKDETEFVIGDTAYRTDGTPLPVVPIGNAKAEAPALTSCRGTAGGWAEAVNTVYNRPRMEPMQYALVSAFGSLLAPFLGSNTYKGVLMALTSAKTGLGKTTVAQFALYAFGDADLLTISGQEGATANALYARMAALNNLPLLLDEFSTADQKFISGLAYAVIEGRERRRLRQSGELQEERVWAMSPYITSNNHLGRLLSADGSSSEAQAVRVFEISLESLGLPKLPATTMLKAEAQVKANRGCAGVEYIKHITTNTAAVAADCITWHDRVLQDSRRLADSRYRFFRGHIATTMAALRVMRELRLLDFDLEAVYLWAVHYIENLISEIAEHNSSSTDDQLSRMVNALSPQIIVSYGYNDGRAVRETPLRPVHGEPVGRHILGGEKVPKQLHNVLALSKHAIRQWCAKFRVDYTTLLRDAADVGAILSDPPVDTADRFVLGRGTDITTGQSRVVFIDMNQLQGVRVLTVVPKPRPTIDTPLAAEG